MTTLHADGKKTHKMKVDVITQEYIKMALGCVEGPTTLTHDSQLEDDIPPGDEVAVRTK